MLCSPCGCEAVRCRAVVSRNAIGLQAKLHLGKFYRDGKGTKVDLWLAREAFKEAADLDQLEAYFVIPITRPVHVRMHVSVEHAFTEGPGPFSLFA